MRTFIVVIAIGTVSVVTILKNKKIFRYIVLCCRMKAKQKDNKSLNLSILIQTNAKTDVTGIMRWLYLCGVHMAHLCFTTCSPNNH